MELRELADELDGDGWPSGYGESIRIASDEMDRLREELLATRTQGAMWEGEALMAEQERDRLRELLRRFGAADSALDESEDGNDMALNDELDAAYLAVLEEGRRIAENRS